jgi:DDE superfamily endonuclease
LQTSGRRRINSHGAFDLETGQPSAIAYHDRSAQMIEALAIDAATIQLLESIAALYPMLAFIHVFLDNARYHHARHVQDWLAQPGCRITLLMSLPNDRPALLPAHERSASNALDARRAVER